MSQSTARFISYDIRPAKQSERSILIDILRIGADVGLPLRSYRYVGMGAIKFYDFLLMHKYLGLGDMVSLEHDAKMYKRAEFNSPFKFVQVRKAKVAEYLANEPKNARAEICWFDYDGGIGPQITADIASAGTRLQCGDFCFVTVYGGPPAAFEKLGSEERLANLQECLFDMAAGLDESDMENANFPAAVHKVLMAAFRNAFSHRQDGEFLPLLRVLYSDSVEMITVGGAFVSIDIAAQYKKKMKQALPFLEVAGDKLYRIRSFTLTERERSLFDRAVTNRRRVCADKNLLKKLGFKEIDLSAYRELVRYLPRYVETMV